MASFARELRSNPTDAELALWRSLRRRRFDGFKFRRQQPLGPYIVDFVCLERRLIIEVDGGGHAEQVEYDAARDEWLREQGFQVLRYWNNEVLGELSAVEDRIFEVLTADAPLLNPPPQGGRRPSATPPAKPRSSSYSKRREGSAI